MENKKLLLPLIILATVLLLYLLFPEIGAKKEVAAQGEELALEEVVAPLELEVAPKALSAEEVAARKELRDLPLDEGSVPDKLLNFLLSSKLNYYREVYEFKNNTFLDDQSPAADFQRELADLSQIMLAYSGLIVEIVCHTNGGETWEEAQLITDKRARAIQTFLLEKGVAERNIYITGRGAENPIADGLTERGKALNERTELLIRGL